MTGDRIPSACYGIAAFLFPYGSRERVALLVSKENIAAGIKAVHRRVYAEKAVVIAAIGRIAAEKLIELIESPRTTLIDKFTVDGILFKGASVKKIH